MAIEPRYRSYEKSSDATYSSKDSLSNWVQLPSGIFVKKLPHTVTKDNNRQSAQRKNKRPWYTKITVWLTVVIAIATVVQTINLILNNISTGKQADSLIVAADRINDAADSFSKSAVGINGGISSAVKRLGEQSRAMNSSNEISRESLQSVQRAFLYVKGFDPTFLDETENSSNRLLLVQPRIRNSGNTQAVSYRTWLNYLPQTTALPEDFKFIDMDEGGSKLTNVPSQPFFFLAPQSDYPIAGRAIPLGYLDLRSPNKRYVYLYGWIRYKDVFRGTPEHRTLFCYQLWADTGTKPPVKGDQIGFGYRACTRHNCTDDQCGTE